MINASRHMRFVALIVSMAGCVGCGDPPNQPPSADAGPDQVVAQDTTVTLNGSGFDPNQPADTLGVSGRIGHAGTEHYADRWQQ